MTRDEYILFIYDKVKRRRVIAWLRRQGVPLTDAEILVDMGCERMLRAYDKTGKENWSLLRGVTPGYVDWKKKNKLSKEEAWDNETNSVFVPYDVETAERKQSRHGRVVPSPAAD